MPRHFHALTAVLAVFLTGVPALAYEMRLTFTPMQSPLSLRVEIDGDRMRVLEFNRYQFAVQSARSTLLTSAQTARFAAAEKLAAGGTAETRTRPSLTEGDQFELVFTGPAGKTNQIYGMTGDASTALQAYLREAVKFAGDLRAVPLAAAYLRATVVAPERRRFLTDRGRRFYDGGGVGGTLRKALTEKARRDRDFLPLGHNDLASLPKEPFSDWNYVLLGNVVYELEYFTGQETTRPK